MLCPLPARPRGSLAAGLEVGKLRQDFLEGNSSEAGGGTAFPCTHTQRAPVLQPGDSGHGHTSDLAGQDKACPHVTFKRLLPWVLDAWGF